MQLPPTRKQLDCSLEPVGNSFDQLNARASDSMPSCGIHRAHLLATLRGEAEHDGLGEVALARGHVVEEVGRLQHLLAVADQALGREGVSGHRRAGNARGQSEGWRRREYISARDSGLAPLRTLYVKRSGPRHSDSPAGG